MLVCAHVYSCTNVWGYMIISIKKQNIDLSKSYIWDIWVSSKPSSL